jgi:hypothetical protein
MAGPFQGFSKLEAIIDTADSVFAAAAAADAERRTRLDRPSLGR